MEMVDIVLSGMSKNCEEGTVQAWFFEEGDMIAQGDELLEVMSEDGMITIVATVAGVLAEVYYDEGDTVEKGEVLCSIDVDAVGEDEDDDDKDNEKEEKEKDEE